MRSLRKRKKNPISAVYKKDKFAFKEMPIVERISKGLLKGATKGYVPKGSSYAVGKVKVFTDKERTAIMEALDSRIEALRKSSHIKGSKSKIVKATAQKEKVKEIFKKRDTQLADEIKKMKGKGYNQDADISVKEAKALNQANERQVLKTRSDAERDIKAIDKELFAIMKIADIGGKKKTPKRKTPKRKTPKRKTPKRKTPKRKTPKRKTAPKKTTRRKTPKRKAGVRTIARTSAKKAVKAALRKGAKSIRVRRKRNPIIASNPVIEVMDNPRRKKKSSKKSSNKKTKKKSSKRKGKKKSSRKSSKKVSIADVLDMKPTKKKSSKKKKIKAISSHPSKKGSKKKSYKKKKHKVKSNPSFGGTMKKIEQLSQDYLGHDLAEAGGLLAGGAAIQGVNHLINSYAPQIKEYAAKIPGVGPILAKNMDAILPFALAVTAHHFVTNPHLKSAAKGVIGASVVNMGTSLYMAASKMVGAPAPLSGIIAVPSMSGIIAVPQMGAYHSSDFGAADGITDADFGGYVTEPMNGSYLQDADFDSAGPIPTAPRSPGQLGSYDAEFSDGEEDSDF